MDTRNEIVSRIAEDGIVPILRTPTAQDALELADVLRGAGLRTLEITLTVPGALEAIKELAGSFSPDLLVGAGTVLNLDDAMKVYDAGARFMVMPVFDASVVSFCRAHGLACFPGALTPSEIFAAWQAGADAVKVFPASAVGGADYIRAVRAPLPDIPLLPTGGITIENAASFIKAGAYALGVGGDLSDVAALHAGQRSVIAERAQLFMEVVREARTHVPQTEVPSAY